MGRDKIIKVVCAAAISVSGLYTSLKYAFSRDVSQTQTSTKITTTTSAPSLFDTKNLPSGCSVLVTLDKYPIAPRISNLDDLVTFLSTESKTSPYILYGVKDKKVKELCKFPIPKYTEKISERVEVIAGMPHIAATSDNYRYDFFGVRKNSQGRIINTIEVYESNLEGILNGTSKKTPQLIYSDNRVRLPIIFPAIANDKYLILEDNENATWVILDLEKARERAKKSNPFTYFDSTKISINQKIPEKIEPVIKDYQKKCNLIWKINHYLERKGIRMYLDDINNEGKYGICVVSKIKTKKDPNPYALIKIDLNKLGYKEKK